MITSNRKTVRQAFATILETALVTTLNLVTDVYAGQVADFQQQSPVVVVASGPTSRKRITYQGTIPQHTLHLHIFVVYATPDGAWTELNAEDALDDIENAVAGVVDANQKNTYWEAITAEPSEPGSVLIGGVEYRHELIRLTFA